MIEIRKCDHPTKSGHGCKQRIWAGVRACPTHETPEDVAYHAGWEEARQWYSELHSGDRESWIAEGKRQAKLEQERTAREVERKKNFRYELDGYPIVQVDGYSYIWTGKEPLGIGDRVMLPQNWLSELKHGRGPFSGTVTEFGTDYDGPLSRIIKKIEDEPKDNYQVALLPARGQK